MTGRDGTLYARWGKRTFDVALSAVLLVVALPLIGAVAVVVRFTLGSPVLFVQQRPGLYGSPFTLRKFRTMAEKFGEDGNALPDDLRMTGVGHWLRSTSLDELPEIWSVMTGDMSLVGPRPLLPEYLPLYSQEQSRRHDVRPGITGWAQVNGRNATTWSERLAMDVWYVEHCSLRLDLKILAQTVAAVLKRDGISAEGSATMPPFEGQA